MTERNIEMERDKNLDAETAYLESLGKSVPAELLFPKKEAIISYDNLVGGDSDRLKEASKKARLIYNRKVDDMAVEYNQLLSQMRDLQDEKYRILESPLTKEDLLEIAKVELPKKQKEFKETFLREHFAECQIRRQTPLSDLNFRLNLGDDAHMLIYLLLSGDDIERAISSLPEIGITKKARDAKLKNIEKEIAELSRIIEGEAEKLGLTAP